MLYMYDTVCHTWYTTLLNNTMVLCCTRQILLSLTGFCRTFLFLLHTVYHSNIISQSHYVIVPMDALCAVDDKYTLITEIKYALDDGVYDIIYLVCIIYIYMSGQCLQSYKCAECCMRSPPADSWWTRVEFLIPSEWTRRI